MLHGYPPSDRRQWICLTHVKQYVPHSESSLCLLWLPAVALLIYLHLKLGSLIEIHIWMLHLRMHRRGFPGCTYGDRRDGHAVAQIEEKKGGMA